MAIGLIFPAAVEAEAAWRHWQAELFERESNRKQGD